MKIVNMVWIGLGLMLCMGCGQKKDLYVPLEKQSHHETAPPSTFSNPSQQEQ